MKKIVLTGLVGLFTFMANAQVFRKGELVEISRSSGENNWIGARIIGVNDVKKEYSVRGTDNKIYAIPFAKEELQIRRPIQALNTSMKINSEACYPTIESVREKIREEFESDFSEYDSVTVTFNALEPQKSYKNTDASFGKTDSDVYPFKVDVTVRLVSTNKDGFQRKINWQFKRKYLLFQNKAGGCEVTMAEREENLLSNI